MATINRPQSETIISTAQWGIPITDQVNANTTAIAAIQPTVWTALTLQNGWVSTLLAQTTPQYRKIGDNVQIRGVIGIAAGGNGTTVFTMPVGFRPYQPFYPALGMYTNGTGLWQMAVFEFDAAGLFKYHPNSPVAPSYVNIGMTFSTIA